MGATDNLKAVAVAFFFHQIILQKDSYLFLREGGGGGGGVPVCMEANNIFQGWRGPVINLHYRGRRGVQLLAEGVSVQIPMERLGNL